MILSEGKVHDNNPSVNLHFLSLYVWYRVCQSQAPGWAVHIDFLNPHNKHARKALSLGVEKLDNGLVEELGFTSWFSDGKIGSLHWLARLPSIMLFWEQKC